MLSDNDCALNSTRKVATFTKFKNADLFGGLLIVYTSLGKA